MTKINRVSRALILAAVAAGLMITMTKAQHNLPTPYQIIEGWAKLPDGRVWGTNASVYPAPGGKNIWIAERCGANLCIESDLDPVMLFDPSGNVIRSFGSGLIAWPHGIFVEPNGNVWVTDAVGNVGEGRVSEGLGHVVYKFSPDGDLLMTLGTKGVAGTGKDTFTKPSDVLVAPNGDIFVADGHDETGNNRIVKFSSDGTYIKEWGSIGSENGEFKEPHALAMDSQGRLFVADRRNNRIQLFDQNGNHLETWTQFGRPSGLYIDKNDNLYSADSESNAYLNPGWKRGIRIGNAKDGFVEAFIPNPDPADQNDSDSSGAEGVAVDAAGNVYGAQFRPRAMKKYVKK